jgi:hypothetical protein
MNLLFLHSQVKRTRQRTVKLCDARVSDAATSNAHIDEVAATTTPSGEGQLTSSQDYEDIASVNESAVTKGKYHETWGENQPTTALPNQHAAAYLVVMSITKGKQYQQYGNQQTRSLSRQSTRYGKHHTPADHGLSCSSRITQAEWGHHRRKDLEKTVVT